MKKELTANQLYKQYVYAKKAQGSIPASFKEWRNLAEEQGILPQSMPYMNADGNSDALYIDKEKQGFQVSVPMILGATIAVGILVYAVYSISNKSVNKNGDNGGIGDTGATIA